MRNSGHQPEASASGVSKEPPIPRLRVGLVRRTKNSRLSPSPNYKEVGWVSQRCPTRMFSPEADAVSAARRTGWPAGPMSARQGPPITQQVV